MILPRLIRHRLLSIALLAAFAAIPLGAAGPAAQAPRWETVQTIVSELSDDSFDVAVREQYIYVFTPRPVSIKLFTILGQLVSQGSLPAGTSRLRLNSRGIYILKAGDVTRRINI